MRRALKFCPRFAPIVVLFCLAGMPIRAGAQNFPPIARATPMPEEVFLGQPIIFSSAESLDPDEGPQPLSFLWDFGDGVSSTGANPSHTFTNIGAYRVSLTVDDGVDTAIDTVVAHVSAPPTAVPPSESSLLALNAGETELWAANPGANSVSVLAVNSNGPVKLAEIPVGRQPRTPAFGREGTRVFVVGHGTSELWVLNATSRNLAERIPVGH